jgi:hypothetical protein
MPLQPPSRAAVPTSLAKLHELHTKCQATIALGGWPLDSVEHSQRKNKAKMKLRSKRNNMESGKK